MLGKLPLLAAAGLFVVGLIGFVLIGEPTPDWSVAPIVSSSAVVEAPQTLSSTPPSSATLGQQPTVPRDLPPAATSSTPTPAASPSPTQPAVLAAGAGSFSPLGPPPASDTPSPTPTPTDTPTPTRTAAAWHWPTATPTPFDFGLLPGLFQMPTSDHRDNDRTPRATATPSATPSPTVAPAEDYSDLTCEKVADGSVQCYTDGG